MTGGETASFAPTWTRESFFSKRMAPGESFIFPTDKKSLFKLQEHGFILKEKDHYQMRVPIFENWVKEFGEVV